MTPDPKPFNGLVISDSLRAALTQEIGRVALVTLFPSQMLSYLTTNSNMCFMLRRSGIPPTVIAIYHSRALPW